MNYYFILGTKKCECCGSKILNEIHIGKKSVGWEFSFQAYKSLNLLSFEDYDTFFNNHENIGIYNEYQEPILWKELRSIILESKVLLNKNQTDEIRENYSNAILKDYYKDSFGFSFCYSDFS